jgi:hypothetical protein
LLGFGKKAAAPGEASLSSKQPKDGMPPRGGGGMRKSADDAVPSHPHESLDDIPVRKSRKSVGWKDPAPNMAPNVDDVLRVRAKSFRAKEGGRQSVTWASSPLQPPPESGGGGAR